PVLSAKAQRALERIGVELRLGARVTGCEAQGLTLATAQGEETLRAGVVLWAAGVAASPAARWLGAPADRAGRVQVLDDLSVPGHRNVFV
ncbi:FAD-dependent oxidoreductase, partial [Enterococcus casseliflavus]|uniref:FAD-dependent oxidoreductase n=1 Tax=Enterococcus casseliflavus TaxID=37734 RepID=UPI003D0B324E